MYTSVDDPSGKRLFLEDERVQEEKDLGKGYLPDEEKIQSASHEHQQ